MPSLLAVQLKCLMSLRKGLTSPERTARRHRVRCLIPTCTVRERVLVSTRKLFLFLHSTKKGGETHCTDYQLVCVCARAAIGALDLLTSRNMTNFIRDPNLAKLSNSLNLTCIVNYPALDKVIQENAEENIKKSKELDAGYNSLDKLSYIIQGGLLSDVGTKIVPAFVNCGGDLKSLLEFTQAIAFWIRGNRDADAKLNPKLVQSYKEGSSEIPFLKTYMEETPEEVYAAFQCAKRFQ